MVTVKIYGVLGHDVGQSSLELHFPGGTLGDLVDHITALYGARVREELLDREGALDCAYGVFRDQERLTALETPIEDGAELIIVSMLAGG